MKKLKFYDVAKRKSFTTDKYKEEKKTFTVKGRKRTVTIAVAKKDGRRVTRFTKNEKAKK